MCRDSWTKGCTSISRFCNITSCISSYSFLCSFELVHAPDFSRLLVDDFQIEVCFFNKHPVISVQVMCGQTFFLPPCELFGLLHFFPFPFRHVMIATNTTSAIISAKAAAITPHKNSGMYIFNPPNFLILCGTLSTAAPLFLHFHCK